MLNDNINTHSKNITVSHDTLLCVSAPAKMEDQEWKQKRFRLPSSRSSSREVPDSPVSPQPIVEQEASSFKEHFVPPELSIWDYFIAKVQDK